MSEETTKKNIFDFAAIITISSILLFNLAWTYWKSYYSILNIDFSFIDMPFEKYIATTWYMLYAVAPGILMIIQYKYMDRAYDLLGLAFVVICIFLSMSVHFVDNSKIPAYFMFCAVVIFLIIRLLTERYNKSIPQVKRTPVIFTILFVIIYSLCFYFYMDKGEKDGSKIKRDFKYDIEIAFNNNASAKGKFISFMNGKYFILIKNKKGKIETFVLNDSEIHHVKFIK